MKYFSTLLLLLVIVLTQPACKKYLDEKSDDSLVVPSTLHHFQTLLDDGSTMNYATPSFATCSADEYFIDKAAYLSNSIQLQQLYIWRPYPYRFLNDWSTAYKAVYNANLCLERIALVPRHATNATEWDQVKGSALFYKAFHYLELAWVFAKAYDESTADTDAGIVLREGTDFLKPSVRATVRQSYQEIVEDAKLAAALLPNEAAAATRPSKCAAYALLARAYTSMRMYDSAGKYADLSLQIRSYLMNYNDPATVARTATNPFKLFNNEVIFHSVMSLMYTLYHASGGPGNVDTVLYAQYHAKDLRREAFFTTVSGKQRFKGYYSGNANHPFSGIATDEMFLIRAEAKARRNDKEGALEDLNTLLQQRFKPADFVPVQAASSAAALDSILWERRKELPFRGSLRWMDVKRLNKEGRAITIKRLIDNELFTLPPNDDRFALQLPEDVIQLTGMQQN